MKRLRWKRPISTYIETTYDANVAQSPCYSHGPVFGLKLRKTEFLNFIATDAHWCSILLLQRWLATLGNDIS